MNYLTAKETRVEKAWSKRGLAGLRSELLQKIGERESRGWTDETVVRQIAVLVYGTLPEREWEKAPQYIAETLGLVGIDLTDYSTEMMEIRLMEETLREEVGDD